MGDRTEIEWTDANGQFSAGRLLDKVEHNGVPEARHG